MKNKNLNRVAASPDVLTLESRDQALDGGDWELAINTFEADPIFKKNMIQGDYGDHRSSNLIDAQLGGTCRIRNPWPGNAITLFRNGTKSEDLTGSLISFSTSPGENIKIVKLGIDPDSFSNEKVN